MGKTIEIFTDRDRYPDDLEKKVREYACPRCSVIVYDTSCPKQQASAAARRLEYGIENLPLPAVTIDGKPVPVDQLEKGAVKKIIQRLFHKHP